MKMTCIVCPNGCMLDIEKVDGVIVVKNAKCKRGIDYANAELIAPKRSLTSTVRTIFEDMPVLPVRTSGEVDKDKILEVMKIINQITVKIRVKRGDIIIKNILDSGVDIISTSDMTRG